jgi:hypothetical protein
MRKLPVFLPGPDLHREADVGPLHQADGPEQPGQDATRHAAVHVGRRHVPRLRGPRAVRSVHVGPTGLSTLRACPARLAGQARPGGWVVIPASPQAGTLRGRHTRLSNRQPTTASYPQTPQVDTQTRRLSSRLLSRSRSAAPGLAGHQVDPPVVPEPAHSRGQANGGYHGRFQRRTNRRKPTTASIAQFLRQAGQLPGEGFCSIARCFGFASA